jgi:hypothetical protein
MMALMVHTLAPRFANSASDKDIQAKTDDLRS